uniref:IRS-type PTB domain-containing protein n=1 Tax=Anabas testudineus TaxID=64144 RepID=A0A3Q1HBE5_ANATE
TMDVIFKEGMLYLQGFKFGKKTWRKIWMVLFKASSTGVGRLEFCNVIDTNVINDQKRVGRQKTERKVVRLSDCLSITLAPKEPCPKGSTAFYVNTTQCTYTMASMTSQEWISALCLLAFQKDPGESDKGVLERENALTMEDNDIYSSWKTGTYQSYQVTVHSTEASRRCKLAGKYLVSLEKEAVLLLALNTGHTIYCWPYRLLRKFGLVEGGFSIEAGRRCESGEGIFIFLSAHGPLIFQGISEKCSGERRSSVQPLSINTRSLCEQSPVTLPTTSNRPAASTAYNPADDFPNIEDNQYSTINEASVLDSTQLVFVEPQLSDYKEAVGAEAEDEDERCHSLEALKLDDDMGENIYYNVRRATAPLIRNDQFKQETDNSECVYADVKARHPPSDQQLQPVSLFPSPAPQNPSCALYQSVSSPPLKSRYPRQPPVNSYTQPEYSAQTQAVDDMQEMEEAIGSSARVGPTEPPGTFKHKLAEIISKDLAKFQPPLPSGAGSPAFSQ